ncbi:MAG: RluA family pseudouridine synthase [Oscillospiraceae bacterium]|jgi:23S rRNA pseudouridine1911/1915/1917 synthase|nr:RluA family pseudouridine synthase [Oscillospiraceae bacterium]
MQVCVMVPEEWDGERLDKVLGGELGLSRSYLQRLIAAGAVLRNGRPAGKSELLREGDALLCAVEEPARLEATPQDIPLDVRYEDGDLLIVNKPRGMVVHPAPGNPDGTLVNALLWHCQGRLSGINGVLRPGIVHRIDKDTSGLLAVAKSDLAHQGLAAQIQNHSFLRAYQAVVHGRMNVPEGTVDAPIGRSERDRKRMAVTQKNAKPARTHYELLTQYEAFAHLRLRLETGRTHQIRVHMAHIGHPVAGDPVYGPPRSGNPPGVTDLQGQCLHAGLLGFLHPRTGAAIEIAAELPGYFTAFLAEIQR